TGSGSRPPSAPRYDSTGPVRRAGPSGRNPRVSGFSRSGVLRCTEREPRLVWLSDRTVPKTPIVVDRRSRSAGGPSARGGGPTRPGPRLSNCAYAPRGNWEYAPAVGGHVRSSIRPRGRREHSAWVLVPGSDEFRPPAIRRRLFVSDRVPNRRPAPRLDGASS